MKGENWEALCLATWPHVRLKIKSKSPMPPQQVGAKEGMSRANQSGAPRGYQLWRCSALPGGAPYRHRKGPGGTAALQELHRAFCRCGPIGDSLPRESPPVHMRRTLSVISGNSHASHCYPQAHLWPPCRPMALDHQVWSQGLCHWLLHDLGNWAPLSDLGACVCMFVKELNKC